MNSFWRIFSLEFIALVRSKALAMLAGASTAWMLLLPKIIRSDGTVDGARELYIRYSLGGVMLLLVIALVASATASIARERAEKRLQLTLVRPVSGFTVAFGKISALVSAGALVLGLSVILLGFRIDTSERCHHVLSPEMRPVSVEAEEEYRRLMSDPKTPPELKKADRNAVLKILEQAAFDRYVSIPTNTTIAWSFPVDRYAFNGDVSVRMRFSAAFDMKQNVCGEFRLSNFTHSIVKVPLSGDSVSDELAFTNKGGKSLLIRSRQDINLLFPADGMKANLFRLWLVMVSALAFVISLGVLFSSVLGRPVALFVVLVMLIVSEMSPAAVENYPDPLGAAGFDRVGLVIAESMNKLMDPVSAMIPLEEFSRNECVEWYDTARCAAVNLAAFPLAVSLIALFVLARKKTD